MNNERVRLGSQYDTGAASVTENVFFFTSQIASLTLNF